MSTKKSSQLLPILGILTLSASSAIGAELSIVGLPDDGPPDLVVTSTSFSFTGFGDIPPCSSNGHDLPHCRFLNQTGADWDTLQVTIPAGDEPVFCTALFGYDQCDAQQGTALLPAVLRFSGGNGIRQGEVVSFAGSGWPMLTTFHIAANVPEPGSIGLIVSGTAVLYLLRRRTG